MYNALRKYCMPKPRGTAGSICEQACTCTAVRAESVEKTAGATSGSHVCSSDRCAVPSRCASASALGHCSCTLQPQSSHPDPPSTGLCLALVFCLQPIGTCVHEVKWVLSLHGCAGLTNMQGSLIQDRSPGVA